MVGDAIFDRIMSDIKRMKTSNDVKFLREHLKQIEMLMGLYREEICQDSYPYPTDEDVPY